MKPSPRQRVADLLLQRPVADYIAEQRAAGASFATIATNLAEATGGEVKVSDEAIRQWHLAATAQTAGAA